MEYTYKYIAQSPGVYGSDTYGGNTYSCVEGDVSCTTEAPNTGFFSAQNTPAIIGGFVAVVLVATIITYAVLRKVNKQKNKA